MIRTLAIPLALVAATAQAAPQRNFTVTSFDRIRVEGPYSVTLATGRAPFARASGGAAQMDAIDLRVEGRTLIVRERSGWSRGPGGPVAIEVGTPDLQSAQLLGSGSLRIDRLKGLSITVAVQGSGTLAVADVQADRVNAAIEGSGELKLVGRAKSATLMARGSPTLLAPLLRADQLTLVADGSAEVMAYPVARATITAIGTARVTLSGSAACTLSVRGSATVTGCAKPR